MWHTTPEHSKAASRVSKANKEKENVTNNQKRRNTMKKSLVPIALAFALIAVAPAAFANATGTLTVQANVANNCTISSPTLDFGAYDPVVANAAAPDDKQTTITVACTKGFTPTIALATGARTISNGTDNLPYELYKDNARLSVWGDGGGQLLTPGVAPGKGGTGYTIYGRINANQDVSAGAYTGSIVATVNF
jgi:spore coat protein U-like protein